MSDAALRVLVTGAGGDLGQAVIKALRLSRERIEVHGSDITSESSAGLFVDDYHSVPPAGDTDNYLQKLSNLCQSLGVKAVIPASEPEITVLSRLDSFPKLNNDTVIVCQPAGWIEKYGDKLSCMQALQGKIKLDPFADGSDRRAVDALMEQTGFPVVVKSRRSSGSRTLNIARTREQLDFCLPETDLPVVQKYIDDDGGEFSAGVFNCSQFSSAIVFRRELGFGGSSVFAETSDDKEVLDYVQHIADTIKLNGSANIQVRKSSAGVRLLEINPRFSSLSAARALCGFRDVEWSLKVALGMELSPPATPYKHIVFRRFLHEAVDFGEGLHTIDEWNPGKLNGNLE